MNQKGGIKDHFLILAIFSAKKGPLCPLVPRKATRRCPKVFLHHLGWLQCQCPAPGTSLGEYFCCARTARATFAAATPERTN